MDNKKFLLKNKIYNLFFQPRCPFCDIITVNGEVCNNCKNITKSAKLLDNKINRGKSVFPYTKDLYSFYLYRNEIISKSIYIFKFSERKQYGHSYALIMKERVKEICDENGVDLIMPVPSFGMDNTLETYHGAQVIAQEISALINVEYNETSLIKIRKTKKQHTLSSKDRMNNLKNAFVVENVLDIKGKVILIVDDVFTTGATINECSKTLISNGAKEVIAVSFAVTI